MKTYNDIYNYYNSELKKLKDKDVHRFLKEFTSKYSNKIIFNNKELLNLASNDYLGLSTNVELLTNFYDNLNAKTIISHYGLGGTGSRLLTGNHNFYTLLETEILLLYGYDIKSNYSALVFNSGYNANVAVLSSIASKGDVIFTDKLNHASIYDGIELSKAKLFRYKHNDYVNLQKLLEQHRNKYKKAFIVSESIFSMDGDVANLKAMVDLKTKHDCLIYIDEAHAFGVYGNNGCGISEENQLIKDIDIIIGTFGKAFASQGAFVLCRNDLKEYIVNHARPFIFTTSLPPINIYWNYFVLKQIKNWNAKRNHLQSLAKIFQNELHANGITSGSSTQIIPIVIGNNAKADEVTAKLREMGYLLFPIKHPVVPKDTARIRISLTANLEWDDIKDLPHLISVIIKN